MLLRVIVACVCVFQFKLAFISDESRVGAGAGDLVDDPRKIASHYLSGFFFIDLFIVFTLPQVRLRHSSNHYIICASLISHYLSMQIIVLLILPNLVQVSSGADIAKSFLQLAVLVQYIPRLFRFLHLLAGQFRSDFVFESAWANFVVNILTFVLAGHVIGSCWYLFGLQVCDNHVSF